MDIKTHVALETCLYFSKKLNAVICNMFWIEATSQIRKLSYSLSSNYIKISFHLWNFFDEKSIFDESLIINFRNRLYVHASHTLETFSWNKFESIFGYYWSAELRMSKIFEKLSYHLFFWSKIYFKLHFFDRYLSFLPLSKIVFWNNFS